MKNHTKIINIHIFKKHQLWWSIFVPKFHILSEKSGLVFSVDCNMSNNLIEQCHGLPLLFIHFVLHPFFPPSASPEKQQSDRGKNALFLLGPPKSSIQFPSDVLQSATHSDDGDGSLSPASHVFWRTKHQRCSRTAQQAFSWPGRDGHRR